MIIRAVCPFDTPIQHIHYSYEKDLLAVNLLSARLNPTWDRRKQSDARYN